ncbi:MAG: diguanylate cyclase [Betaproteobacteria bacterium]
MESPRSNRIAGAAFATPHEIARETLRRIAVHREQPTPVNYLRVYQEVSGQPCPEQQGDDWLELLRLMQRQLRQPHQGYSSAQKMAAIEKVLDGAASTDADKAKELLRRLLQRWSGLPTAPETAFKLHNEDGADSEALLILAGLFSQALERAVVSRISGAPELVAEIRELAARLRTARDAEAIGALATPLRQLWYRLSLYDDEGDRLRQGLLRVLHLLIENIQEITTDDQWLHGQLESIKDIISAPLTIESLEQIERCLRETIVRQGVLKHSLSEAKDRLKEMAGTFIKSISELSSVTGEYHDKITALSGRLQGTDDIGEISMVMDEIMHETRQMQVHAMQSRDSLIEARRMVELSEQRISELEAELVQVSEKVREDQLTGTLNRRGMDEVFEREIAIRNRSGRPLALALLDVDNFKKINDIHGHQAGDGALVHLSRVFRQTMRPNDSVARFGGEEFLILLPDSTAEEAEHAIIRLQRSLTKHFFLHESEHLLITFSAGVTEHAPGEKQPDVISRADKALYRAKAAGKNRVITVLRDGAA